MNLLLCLSILAAVVVIWCTVPALWVLCLPDVGINGDKFTWVMDPATGRSRAGWVLRHHNGAYQLHATRRLGPVCLRTNYGHKVDFTTWQRPTMPVVCIAISALSWKEPDPLTAA